MFGDLVSFNKKKIDFDSIVIVFIAHIEKSLVKYDVFLSIESNNNDERK